MTEPNVNQINEASSTSLSLLERARARDETAWVRLANLYGPLIERWCKAAGLQEADAADVRQDVFTVMARSIETFRRDRPGDSFRGWLYAITRNKIRDRFRKAEPAAAGGSDAQRQLALVPAQDEEPDAPMDLDEERIVYLKAVEMIRGEFEAKTWQAFWEVTIHGRGPAEVAESLGMTRNSVYLARSRILRRMRQEFSGLIPLSEESN